MAYLLNATRAPRLPRQKLPESACRKRRSGYLGRNAQAEALRCRTFKLLAEKGSRGSVGAGVSTIGCMRSLFAGNIRSVVRRDPPYPRSQTSIMRPHRNELRMDSAQKLPQVIDWLVSPGCRGGRYWEEIGVVSTFCIHQDHSHALHEQDSAVGVPAKGGRDGSLQGG